jgi:PAS domain S-box-containing protein
METTKMKHSFIVPLFIIFSLALVVAGIRTGKLFQKQNNEIAIADADIEQLVILSKLVSEGKYLHAKDTASSKHLPQVITENNRQIIILAKEIIARKQFQGMHGGPPDSLILFLQSLITKESAGTGLSFLSSDVQLAILDQLTNSSLKSITSRVDTLGKYNASRYNELEMLLYGACILLTASAVIYSLDIRKAKKIQSAKEEKLAALLDAAPDATVIVDEKGKITAVSKQTEHLFEYDRSELIGLPVEILIDAALRNVHAGHRFNFMQHATVRVMEGGLELKARKKSGQLFPVEIYLSPVHTKEGLLVSASIRDISVTKKSEEKFRSLLESAPDATVIVNVKGEIQMVNKQTEEVFQYSKEELIGKAVEILIPMDIRSKHVSHRADFSHSPRRREMGEGIELKAVKKDGTLFPVEISLSPINTEDGMLISAAVRDITARKALEKELIKTNAEMEAFTYSVSHDLRAPLRGIIGFTSMLEEDYTNQLDDEAKRITGIIKSNTAKMGRLIDDLLAFSRMGKTEIVKEKIDSNILVRDVISEIMQQNRHLDISWDVKPLNNARGDIQTIRQVWINLISNAVKYSSQANQPLIIIDSYVAENQTCFLVRDNGVGFNEQYKHKLFKVFQRLHDVSQFEGTGVGLALVEKIISKHGGKVWAEGEMNEGACFYFSLPH